MSKLTKIITAIVAVCLLCGAVCLAAFAASEETVTLKWLDPEGRLIKSEEIAFGTEPSADGINPDYVDVTNGTLYDYTVTGWAFDLGDGDEAIRAITSGDATAGSVIEVKPVVEGDAVTSAVKYYIGVYDETSKLVRPSLSTAGSYEAYSDINTVKTQVNAAADKATVVLTSDMYVVTAFNVENKTLSFDLNGHDVVRLQGTAASDGTISGGCGSMFNMYSGATVNLYSSREGGRIFEGLPRRNVQTITIDGAETTVPVGEKNQSYQASGLFSIGRSVSVAKDININVGKFRGSEYGIEYTGGSFVYGVAMTAETEEEQKNINVNVNGGSLYLYTRPAYALFVTARPNFNVNLKDADIYVAHATYSVFHDYEGGETNATISGCNILSVNVDNKTQTQYTLNSDGTVKSTSPIAGTNGSYSKLFYSIRANSKLKIEDSTVIAQLYRDCLTGAEFVIGGGNVIAANTEYVSHLKFEEGVTVLHPSEDKAMNVSLSFAHAPIYNDYTTYLNFENEDYLGGKYTVKDGVLDAENYVTATGTKPLYCVTVKGEATDRVLPFVSAAKWYNPNGELYTTTYGFAGDEIAIPDVAFDVEELENGWFDIGYPSWKNVTEGAAADSLVLLEGVNEFNPVKGPVVDLKGTKLQLDMTSQQIQYYTYIPKPVEAEGQSVEFELNGDSEKGIGIYGEDGKLISTNNSTTSITVNGVSISVYRNRFYAGYVGDNGDDASGRVRTVKFNAVYDFDGDGEAESVPVEKTFYLSVNTYVRGVLAMYGHGTEEATLAYELVRMTEERYQYANSDTTNAYAEFHSDYAEICDCGLGTDSDGRTICKYTAGDLAELAPESKAEYSELTKYIHSVNFALGSNKGFFRLYLVPKDGETYDVAVKYKTPNSSAAFTVTAEDATEVENADGTTVSAIPYKLSSYKTAYIAAEMTITLTVTDANGETASYEGTYSLAEYIKNNPDVDAAKALYAFSVAAAEYKFVTKSESEASE